MADQNRSNKGLDPGKSSGLNVGGSTPGVSTRLPSFRGPRDLTLSASTSGTLVKPSLATRPRKTFSPNIPVRREKNDKTVDPQSDKAPKRNRERDKGRRDGGRERGRGRGRAKEYVQTTGSLFGEGIAAATQRRGFMGGYGGGGGGGSGGGGGGGKLGDPGFLHKPVLNLESVNNIDKEHEDQKLKEILRDDFIDDPDDTLGRFSEDDDLLPVQLPMVRTGRGFKEEDHKQAPPIKCDPVTVKSEPMDPDDENIRDAAENKLNIKPPDIKMPMKGGLPTKEKSPELTVAQLLTTKNEELMFIQLPNSLPSHPPEVKQEPNITRSQNTSQQQQEHKASSSMDQDEEEDKKPNKQFCTLNTLPEGQIGKLKVYKSGKVELWFGDHKLAVTKGTQVGFLQDAASVEIDEENKTGDITVLGHIRHRLVCTPNLEALVKQMKTS